MPEEDKKVLNLFLTVENIFGIRSINRPEIEDQLKTVIDRMSKLKKKDIIKYYDSDATTDVYWNDRKYFENLIDQIKIYLQLRPELLENYPELLIWLLS